MDTFSKVVRRKVSEALKATAHSDAARAMLRVDQRAMTPLGAEILVVTIIASRYDIALLRALTGKSEALEDAYYAAVPYTWVDRFLFVFVPAEEASGDLSESGEAS